MALARRTTEDDRAFSIDADHPNVAVVLLEPARHSGDRSRGADADEDVVQRLEIGADLSRREFVVRLDGVRIVILVRPVSVRNGVTEFLHLPQTGLQKSAGFVALL